MIKKKNYDIFCYINKKKQIALTKENNLGFLNHFNLPKIKESNPKAKIQINTNGSIRSEDVWWDTCTYGGSNLTFYIYIIRGFVNVVNLNKIKHQ